MSTPVEQVRQAFELIRAITTPELHKLRAHILDDDPRPNPQPSATSETRDGTTFAKLATSFSTLIDSVANVMPAQVAGSKRSYRSVVTKKINGLLAVDYLHTIGDLKASLGSCVFINRFIKDYTMITESSYALEARYKTKKTPIRKEGGNCNGTNLHERAFKTLKAALATAPCLAFLDWPRPFIIVADCSKYQMGGALLQLDKEGKCIYIKASITSTSEVWGNIERSMCTSPLFKDVLHIHTMSWEPMCAIVWQ